MLAQIPLPGSLPLPQKATLVYPSSVWKSLLVGRGPYKTLEEACRWGMLGKDMSRWGETVSQSSGRGWSRRHTEVFGFCLSPASFQGSSKKYLKGSVWKSVKKWTEKSEGYRIHFNIRVTCLLSGNLENVTERKFWKVRVIEAYGRDLRTPQGHRSQGLLEVVFLTILYLVIQSWLSGSFSTPQLTRGILWPSHKGSVNSLACGRQRPLVHSAGCLLGV